MRVPEWGDIMAGMDGTPALDGIGVVAEHKMNTKMIFVNRKRR
jgi:hypothetical protein